MALEHLPLSQLTIQRPKSPLKVSDSSKIGLVPFYTSGVMIARHSESLCSGENIFIATGGKANFQYWNGPAAYSTDTLVITGTDRIETKYLYYFLQMKTEHINEQLFQGAALKHLSRPAFNNLLVPFRPLLEQMRIVDVVTSVDAYIASLQQKAEAARAARDAVLHELLESVAAAPQRPLKTLTSKIGSGATPRGGEAGYQSSGVTLIRSQNVRDGRFLHEGLVAIGESAAKALEGVSVEENDVLINITGASVARACIVDQKILPARVNQHVSILRTDRSQLLPGFLLQILLGKKMKSYLLDISGSGTTRQAITKAQLDALEVLVPKLDEQQRIVDIVLAMDNAIRLTEHAVTDAQQLRMGMLSDLLSGDHEIPETYDRLLGVA